MNKMSLNYHAAKKNDKKKICLSNQSYTDGKMTVTMTIAMVVFLCFFFTAMGILFEFFLVHSLS